MTNTSQYPPWHLRWFSERTRAPASWILRAHLWEELSIANMYPLTIHTVQMPQECAKSGANQEQWRERKEVFRNAHARAPCPEHQREVSKSRVLFSSHHGGRNVAARNSGRQRVGAAQRQYYVNEEVRSSFWELLIWKNRTASVLRKKWQPKTHQSSNSSRNLDTWLDCFLIPKWNLSHMSFLLKSHDCLSSWLIYLDCVQHMLGEGILAKLIQAGFNKSLVMWISNWMKRINNKCQDFKIMSEMQEM